MIIKTILKLGDSKYVPTIDLMRLLLDKESGCLKGYVVEGRYEENSVCVAAIDKEPTFDIRKIYTEGDRVLVDIDLHPTDIDGIHLSTNVEPPILQYQIGVPSGLIYYKGDHQKFSEVVGADTLSEIAEEAKELTTAPIGFDPALGGYASVHFIDVKKEAMNSLGYGDFFEILAQNLDSVEFGTRTVIDLTSTPITKELTSVTMKIGEMVNNYIARGADALMNLERMQVSEYMSKILIVYRDPSYKAQYVKLIDVKMLSHKPSTNLINIQRGNHDFISRNITFLGEVSSEHSDVLMERYAEDINKGTVEMV